METIEVHTLRTSIGALVITITKTQDRITVYCKSPGSGIGKNPKFLPFMAKHIGPLGDDPRPLHITGNLVDYTGIVIGSNAAGGMAWQVLKGGLQ